MTVPKKIRAPNKREGRRVKEMERKKNREFTGPERYDIIGGGVSEKAVRRKNKNCFRGGIKGRKRRRKLRR